jgi:5-methylcytosine-specific restriction endonuclease McrA
MSTALKPIETRWWGAYRKYLAGPRWRAKRKAVIARDKLCQACGSRPAVQAHHRSYAHVGDEPLFDLVGVCIECHEKLHDREAFACALRRNCEQAGILTG